MRVRKRDRKPPVTMTRHQSVLDMLSTRGPRVRFSREREEEGEVNDTVYISRTDWEDMGKPDKITLTVEPGDKLNTKKGEWSDSNPHS